MDLHDLQPASPSRHADLDLAVEATRTTKGRIDGVLAVGRADDDDLATAAEAVHQGEQLRDHAAFRLSRHVLALGRDGVDLVDEDYGRRFLLCLLELLPQLLLALPVVLGHDLWTVDAVEVRPRLVRHGLGDERLARSRRTVQQHAPGGNDAEAFEQLGMLERQFDDLAHALQLVPEASDVVVGDRRRSDLLRLHRFGLYDQLAVAADDHHPGRLGADDHERQEPSHEGDVGNDDGVALHQGAVGQPLLEQLLHALAEAYAFSWGDLGRHHDLGGRLRLRPVHRDLLPDADAGVGAYHPVDGDESLPLILLGGPEHLGRGLPLANYLDEIAHVHAQRLTGLGVHPGPAQTHLGLMLCARHLKHYRFAHAMPRQGNRGWPY